MLKTIMTLGAGVALGCYYKSHKEKCKSSDEKKGHDHDAMDEDKEKKGLHKFLK